jgi:hypothetical protein
MTSLFPLPLFTPSSSPSSSSSSSDRVDSGTLSSSLSSSSSSSERADHRTCSSSSSSLSSVLPHNISNISPVLDSKIHDVELLKVTSCEEPWVTLTTSRNHPLDTLSHADLLHMIVDTDMNIPYATVNNAINIAGL